MSKFARVDAVKHSFFYCVIPLWNSLPEHVVNQKILISFATYAKHIFQRINICVYSSVHICYNEFVVKYFFHDDGGTKVVVHPN